MKILRIYLFVLVVCFLPSIVAAASGACSYHGGVDCSAGADYDGSVVCNDGWTNSSVSYSSMVMCGGGSNNSYDSYSNNSYYSSRYSSGPQCPSLSLPDGLTGQCKCISGYVADTDTFGNQSCVSADSVCTDQLGYGGRYNSLSNKCECRYGYLYDGNKCTSEYLYCSNLIGLMSDYNSLTKQCECMSGYEFDGSSCVYKKKTSYYDYGDLANNGCPVNSSQSLTDISKCECNAGYKISDSRDSCVLAPTTKTCPLNSSLINNQCFCNSGYKQNLQNNGCELIVITAKAVPVQFPNATPTKSVVKAPIKTKVKAATTTPLIKPQKDSPKATASTSTSPAVKKGWFKRVIDKIF